MADTVNVVNASGEVEQVPPEALDVYLRSGYSLDTPELAQIRADKEKYGGTGSAIKAFGEEMLNAPTLGVGHRAEEALGVDKEDILKRKLYNPGASTAGGLAGIGASMLVPGVGEAEGLGEGAAALTGAGVRAADGLGEAAGEGVSAVTRRLLDGIPGGDKAAELAGGTANSIAQAEVYNAADKIDEDHLAGGNIQQGIENAMATSGDALKLGAGIHLGAAVGGGLLVKGAQKSLDALQDTIRKIVPEATGAAADTFARASSAVTGEPLENFAKYTGEEGAEGRKELLDIKPPPTNKELAEQRDVLAKDLTEKMQDALSTAKELKFKTFDGIVPEERSALLKQVDPAKAANEAQDIGQAFRADADKIAANESIFGKNIAAKALAMSKDYDEKLGELNYKIARDQIVGKPSDFYDLIEDTKRTLGKLAYEKGGSIMEKDAMDVLKESHSMMKESLENPETWGLQAGRQQSLNRASSDLIRMLGGKSGKKKAAFKRLFLEEDDSAHGPIWTVSQTKVNTFLGKLGAASGERQLDALKQFLDSSQELIEQTRKSGATVGRDLSQDKYVQSLMQTAKESGALDTLGKAHENIAASRGVVQQGIEQQGDQAKMRALANGPFVTGIDPQTGRQAAGAGSLGPVGGAALGATLGHVGLAGVGAVAAVRGVLKALHDPLGTLQTLAKIERFNDTTSRRIQSGIAAFLKKAESGAEKVYDKARSGIAYEEAKSIKEPYKKQLSRMLKDNADPVIASAKFHTALSGSDKSTTLAEHAPKFAKAVADKQARIQQWLWQQFPKDQSQYPAIGGSKFSSYQPSRAELQEYYDKEAIATHPMHAVELLKQGTLSAGDVSVLSALWPKIYEQLKFAATEKLADTKHDLTTRQRRQLSVLVGQPIEDAQDPQLFALVQKNFADQDQAKKAAAAQADKGLTKIADDSKTASQRLQK